MPTMSQPDIAAAMKAKAQQMTTLPKRDETSRPERSGKEATHNVTVRLPVSLDDRLEEFLFHVNRAARTAGHRTLAKRELIELAIREIITRAPGDVLDQAI
jgi:hypothetical protein